MEASGWRLTSFGNICEHSAFGPRFSSDEYAPNGNVACLRTKDISIDGRIELTTMPLARLDLTRMENHILQEEDLVITRTGRVGSAAVFKEFRLPVLPGAFLIRFRLIREVANPWFFRYFFNSPHGQQLVLSVATGSVQQNLNITNLHSLQVPLPPLSEQNSISRVLGALDDKIELNRRMNRTLEAIGRAIFKSWFVDFDPVHTKARGEQPKDMDPATAALFPDTFEDSELGPIPVGWKIGTMRDEFNLTMGTSPPGSTYNEVGDGLPFFQGTRDFGFRFPKKRVFCTEPKRFADPDDTLVSVRAPVGDINMASEYCCVGRGVAAIRHKSASRSYTYYAMQTLRETFDRFEAEGTVFGSIGKTDFENLGWIAATAKVVTKFEAIMHPLDEQIEVNERESQTLASIRDALLPKLLSGEIRVPPERSGDAA